MLSLKTPPIEILPVTTLLIGFIIIFLYLIGVEQIYDNSEKIMSQSVVSFSSSVYYNHGINSIIPSSKFNSYDIMPVDSSLSKKGIWQSAMVDESGDEQVDQKSIKKFENASGKNLALVVFSNDWYDGIFFPTLKANIIKKNNAVPIIRMAPWINNGQNLSDAGPYSVSNISAGLHDKALIKWAKAAKAFSSPILVDFGYEPNADYFPWSKEGPSKYIAAYRHVVDIFRQQNVSNVYFVYHPDMGTNVNDMKKWYPGDKYVDWILASAYGEDDDMGCLGILNKSYHQLVSISLTKPLGIEEWGIGSQDDTKNTLDALANNKFPKIKILSIWNEGSSGGKDRRIEQSSEMLNAYRDGIANSIYLSSNFDPASFKLPK